MSYREKAAWAGFITYLIVWGGYFGLLAWTVRTGGSLTWLFSNVGVYCLTVSVLPIAFLQRRASKREVARPDERERTVEMRSGQIAYITVTILILAGMFAAVFMNRALVGLSFREPGHVVVNIALALIMSAELARFASQIVLYRRGGV